MAVGVRVNVAVDEGVIVGVFVIVGVCEGVQVRSAASVGGGTSVEGESASGTSIVSVIQPAVTAAITIASRKKMIEIRL